MSNSYQKIAKEVKLSNSFSVSIITMIPKPDKDTTEKRKIQVNITVNIDTKIFNKILEIQIQQHIKRIIFHAWSSVIYPRDTKIFHYLQVNQCDIPHQLTEEYKSYDHLNRCRQSFWQYSTSIYDKRILQKLDIEGTYIM